MSQWDNYASLSSVVPVSAILGSGNEFGFISNPGANTMYFENPLYVPILLSPGPQFGQATPDINTVGNGVIVPPYSWVTLPVGAQNSVVYNCVAYSAVNAARSASFSAQPAGARGLMWRPTATQGAYPAGNCAPRAARYYFFDSPSPVMAKGSLLRQLAQVVQAEICQVGDPLTGGYGFFLGGGVGLTASPVRQVVGSSLSSLMMGQNVDRLVITGINVVTNEATSAVAPRGYITSSQLFYDEMFDGTTVYPDVQMAAVLNIGQEFGGKMVNSTFTPLPGIRHFIFQSFGTNATPRVSTVNMRAELYLSEF